MKKTLKMDASLGLPEVCTGLIWFQSEWGLGRFIGKDADLLFYRILVEISFYLFPVQRQAH